MASRLTFRPEAGTIAWQKQLRDHFAEEPAPPVDLTLKNARIRPVSRRIAAQVILKYEWLGTLPNCPYYYGLFFGPYCAGVTCVQLGGGSANVNAHQMLGVARTEMAYLCRGANTHWSPAGANSKLVSWTGKLLARDTTARVLIAYSDTDAGEIGTIYQACGWTYIGKGASTRQWIAPNGRIYDQKKPYDLAKRHGGSRSDWTEKLRLAGWKEQQTNPKGRYVCVLDKSDAALLAHIESLRQPYPKRS